MQRKQRVVREPELHQPHVVISVRHTSLGTISHVFSENALFYQVYDYVGSLCLRPEHFLIKDYYNKTMTPDIAIYSGVFNMVESNEPIIMTPNGEVGFSGFGVSSNDNGSDYEVLQQLRENERKKLIKELVVEISRENVYEEFIALYRKRYVANTDLKLLVSEEYAVGDGVARDIYTEYFQQIYLKLRGHSAKVPRADFDEGDIELFGKISTFSQLACAKQL